MKYYKDGQWKDIQVKVANAIGNEYGDSQNDGYSQEYLNDKLVNVGTEVNEDYRVNVLKSNNLYNKATDILGYVLATNGALNSAQGFCVSDYIPVKPNTQYTISRVYDSSASAEDAMRIGYYTSDKTFIERPYSSDKPYIITTPSNCYFVRLSYEWVKSNTNVQLEEGSTATTYEAYSRSINVDGENIYSKPTVLWTNPSPTSDFANQTITLNDAIENYSYYEVIYKESKSSPNYKSCKLPVGLNMRMEVDIGFMFIRIVNSMSGTSMGITECVYYATYGSATTTQSNNAVIPYQVIGYGKKATSSSQTRSLQTISIPENDDEGEIVRGEEE